MTKRAVFIGRWSPFHKGHLAIMKKQIDEGLPLLILVRDTHYDLYPTSLRKQMIEHTMEKLDIDAKVLIIDDIESINYGRDVGYEVNEIDAHEDLREISSTKIRELIKNDKKSWVKYIPPGAREVLMDFINNSERINNETYFKIKNGISRRQKSELLGFENKILWFTGLPCSGKTTLAKSIERELHNRGVLSFVLDGDDIRHCLNTDLKFSKKEREENIRRVREIAKLFYNSGIFVICSFISPFKKDREKVKEYFGKDLIEIYTKCSVEVCKKRDNKGLYKKAEEGSIKNFTGVNQSYEEPDNPEVIVDTDKLSIGESVKKILDYLG